MQTKLLDRADMGGSWGGNEATAPQLARSLTEE